jgi:16S rRNA (guanine(1405)-N(7))-methyltransferase
MSRKTKTVDMIEKISQMPKYKQVQIPVETVRDIIDKAVTPEKVREKIHNIVALYLGDLDYDEALREFLLVKDNPDELKAFCLRSLMQHASTRERGVGLEELYKMLFAKVGKVSSIADLACGLHPLGIPFMNLPQDTAYYAYDLHKKRAEFMNAFIRGLGFQGGGFQQDILINPPLQDCHSFSAGRKARREKLRNDKEGGNDVVFFFKEAHRLEKRETGAFLRLLKSINADKIVVSLPIKSLGTQNLLSSKYQETIEGHYDHESFECGNEVFYVISKEGK